MAAIQVALDLRRAEVRERIGAALVGIATVRLGRAATVVFTDTPAAGTVAVLDGPGAVCPAVRAGAIGLVLADDPDEHFGQAARQVFRHGGWISPRLTGALLGLVPAAAVPAGLTPRERAVLDLLADGLDNAEIARLMVVSVSAVKFHVSNILRKFGCRDRTHLVARIGGRTWSVD